MNLITIHSSFVFIHSSFVVLLNIHLEEYVPNKTKEVNLKNINLSSY